MQLFVWIPGVLGSRLERRSDRAEIWPPSPTAVDGLADRTFAQLTGDLVASKVIDAVCVVPIYSPLDALFVRAGILDYDASRPQPRSRYPFAYDWRQDVATQADVLAGHLDGMVAAGDEIVFVAHSMGNYIVRELIETGRFDGRPFRGCVTKYISINGPHAGGPVMVARLMGLDKMDHIVAADVPRLLSAAPFAAGCELMPAPGRDGLFNQAAPVDLYDPATVAHFGWGAQNMATARRFWADLAAGGRAPGVEYVIVRSFLDGDGTGQSTIADVRWNGAAWVVERGPGDGAVPVWSCEAIGRPDVVLPGEHLGVLATQGFADQVFAPHIAPLVDLEFLAITASLKLQPLSRDVPAGGPARFAIVQDVAVAAGDLQGALIWTPLTATGALDPSRRPVRTEVSLQPMEAASVVTVTAPARPGVYRVVLQGAADGVKITGAPGATVIVAASARAAHPPPP